MRRELKRAIATLVIALLDRGLVCEEEADRDEVAIGESEPWFVMGVSDGSLAWMIQAHILTHSVQVLDLDGNLLLALRVDEASTQSRLLEYFTAWGVGVPMESVWG